MKYLKPELNLSSQDRHTSRGVGLKVKTDVVTETETHLWPLEKNEEKGDRVEWTAVKDKERSAVIWTRTTSDLVDQKRKLWISCANVFTAVYMTELHLLEKKVSVRLGKMPSILHRSPLTNYSCDDFHHTVGHCCPCHLSEVPKTNSRGQGFTFYWYQAVGRLRLCPPPQYIIKERHRCHEIYGSEIVVLHHRECSLDGTNLFGWLICLSKKTKADSWASLTCLTCDWAVRPRFKMNFFFHKL